MISYYVHLNCIKSTLTSQPVHRSGYLMADRGIGARYSVEETSELSALCSSHFTPGERTLCTLSTGRYVSSRAGVDGLKDGKIFCVHRQSNRSHPTGHPVAESTVTEQQYLRPQSVSTQICKGSVQKKVSSKDKGLQDVRRKQS